MSLPRVTTSMAGLEIVCPWCRSNMDHATVRVGDLMNAWEAASPDWPDRSEVGETTTTLVTDCPTCLHPSAVALCGAALSDRDNRWIKLVPVRTPTDARFLGSAA